ncbi:MAG: STAS domain-containing protein [Firmicutes bacterium]|nr:STAS domain-containing protein [Bacillota bacterium]
MIITTERIGPNLIVTLNGELDLETSPVFREAVDSKLNLYDSISHLILDCKGVNFIDSSGLGVILGRFKKLNQTGGRLSIINASEQLKQIMKFAGLFKIIGVYEDRRQALESSGRVVECLKTI